MIAGAIRGMASEQALAIVSTTKLNAVQIAAALTTTKMSDAEIVAALVNEGWCATQKEAEHLLSTDAFLKLKDAASTDLLTAASLKLKAAFQGIGATIKAHPVLAAVAAAGLAITGIIAAYKKWGPTQENLAKKLDDAKQEVQESTQKIQEMESELTNVRDRIAELKGMGSLTIVQQKELDNLEKSGAQLERNIELEKEYRRLKKKDANKAFVDWFNKDMKDKTEYTYSTADKSDGANSGFRKIANFFAPGIDARMRAEQNNCAPTMAELNNEQGAHLVFSSGDETFEIDNQFEQAKKLIAQKNQEITLEQKEQIDSQLEEIEKHFLDKTKELEETLGDKEAELTWTPNAVAGTDEAEVNDIIVYMDELRDQATLLKGEIHNDISGAYEDIVNANLKSDRFSEAAKQIEELKTAEDGTARTSKH